MIKKFENFLRPVKSSRFLEVKAFELVLGECESDFFASFGVGILLSMEANFGKEIDDLKNSLISWANSQANVEFFGYFKLLTERGVITSLIEEGKRYDELKSYVGNFFHILFDSNRIVIDPNIPQLQRNFCPIENEEFFNKACEKINITLLVISPFDFKCYGHTENSIIILMFSEKPTGFNLIVFDQLESKNFPILFPLAKEDYIKLSYNCNKIEECNDERRRKKILRRVERYKKKECFCFFPEKLIKFYQIYKVDNCSHNSFNPYKTLCGKYHCVECLIDKNKNAKNYLFKCICEESLPIYDFCEVCKIYEENFKKLDEKNNTEAEKDSTIANEDTNENAKINKVKTNKKIKNKQSDKQVTLSDLKKNSCNSSKEMKLNICIMCDLPMAQRFFSVMCDDHWICLFCRLKAEKKCKKCDRHYSDSEKQEIKKVKKLICNECKNPIDKDKRAINCFCHDLCRNCAFKTEKCYKCEKPFSYEDLSCIICKAYITNSRDFYQFKNCYHCIHYKCCDIEQGNKCSECNKMSFYAFMQ